MEINDRYITSEQQRDEIKKKVKRDRNKIVMIKFNGV